MTNNLKKTIMRRVYYSYAVSFVSQSMLWQGFLLGACIALFGRLTHVASIARNFSHTSVENAPGFIFNSFANALAGGEIFTVLVVCFICALSVKALHQTLSVLRALRSVRLA